MSLDWIQRKAHERNSIKPIAAPMLNNFLNTLKDYRTRYRVLYCYDWVPVPLVYTQVEMLNKHYEIAKAQVVSMAVYGYFLFTLIGRQRKASDIDIFFPFFTTLQFLFYVGWFKVNDVDDFVECFTEPNRSDKIS